MPRSRPTLPHALDWPADCAERPELPMKTSEHLTPGTTLSRKQLGELFDIRDATLNTGIFRPMGHDSVWIFVTERKTPDRTQYVDRLVGDDLYFEGQTLGRTDSLIKEHAQRGLELLVFHRLRKSDRSDYSFNYRGPFDLVSAEAGPPTRFHLRLAAGPRPVHVVLEAVASEAEIRENIRRFARDAPAASLRALSLIRQTSFWVFDRDSGTFGPSKFVGYSRMTLARYDAAVAGTRSGIAFDGHATRKCIAAVIGEFAPNALLSDLLTRQVSTMFGADAIAGVDREKWVFASTTPARRHYALVCNPAKFDGKGAVEALRELAWTVDRGEFSVGDRVALWQAKGRGTQRGVIALGEVTRGVVMESCPEPERAFWRGDDVGDHPRIRFRVLPTARLPLWESAETPWLTAMAAARARGGTVFSLAPAEWHAVAAAAQIETDPETNAGPGATGVRGGQGRGLTAAERRAVELHAQRLAEEHFVGLGHDVRDVSSDCLGFDLRCTNGMEVVHVEVKGTTGAGDTVLLTRNEVAHAREQHARVALVVVSGIRLLRRDGTVSAEGGTMQVIRPWAINDGELSATQFEYRPKR